VKYFLIVGCIVASLNGMDKSTMLSKQETEDVRRLTQQYKGDKAEALVQYVRKMDLERVSLLLRAGAQVNKLVPTENNKRYETALIAASKLPVGAEINKFYEMNVTRLQIVESLLAARANINQEDTTGTRALTYLIRGSKFSCPTLWQSGAQGLTDYSVAPELIACTKKLITADTDVTYHDTNSGLTPLQIIAERGNPCLVIPLLKAGANQKHILDLFVATPLTDKERAELPQAHEQFKAAYRPKEYTLNFKPVPLRLAHLAMRQQLEEYRMWQAKVGNSLQIIRERREKFNKNSI
jgi:hypothetical protein